MGVLFPLPLPPLRCVLATLRRLAGIQHPTTPLRLPLFQFLIGATPQYNPLPQATGYHFPLFQTRMPGHTPWFELPAPEGWCVVGRGMAPPGLLSPSSIPCPPSTQPHGTHASPLPRCRPGQERAGAMGWGLDGTPPLLPEAGVGLLPHSAPRTQTDISQDSLRRGGVQSQGLLSDLA